MKHSAATNDASYRQSSREQFIECSSTEYLITATREKVKTS